MEDSNFNSKLCNHKLQTINHKLKKSEEEVKGEKREVKEGNISSIISSYSPDGYLQKMHRNPVHLSLNEVTFYCTSVLW